MPDDDPLALTWKSDELKQLPLAEPFTRAVNWSGATLPGTLGSQLTCAVALEKPWDALALLERNTPDWTGPTG